jgi:DNA repair protein RecO
MAQVKSFSTQGIVLKRSNTGEADKIITILSQDYGKIVCVVKGVRKITSSKKATFEPGNIIKGFLLKPKACLFLLKLL